MIPVWFQGKRVGFLDMAVPDHRRSVVFKELNEETGVVREIVHSLKPRNNEIDISDISPSRTIEAHIRNIFGMDPKDCTIERNEMRYIYRVSWRHIVAESLDQYEYLFDQRCFIPD